jgi:hypothetical protein
MARLLSKQDDFWNQESLLEQRIKARGHHCVFLPKFHCELNLIDMVCLIHFYSHITVLLNILQYWGWAKHRYRDVYKKRFDAVKKIVRESLDTCPEEVVQWFFNCSWWFIDAYRQGLMGKVAEWAIQK